ncbi:MAG: hypothetical protein ACK4M9_08345 [Anaerobacillus sp.]|uniref:hypothetical protein n=1 Tax=Anaerobacillus sp. TaxID=1872506 RepID=UPI00391CAEF5
MNKTKIKKGVMIISEQQSNKSEKKSLRNKTKITSERKLIVEVASELNEKKAVEHFYKVIKSEQSN